ncbi:hypothetical protein MNV_810010 [Candidatus Methanoperedens nitroreducens]|uniref:Uncharacterized protein n=1 Tax=Candidatus Methanoperedens nitratireducens TaxID=1392998 RepID=A0A284VU04_9EURY|nr:hypothetical protein MNV_810010 [Candidatus Methanoperedens nitroreducens]
MIVVSDVHLGYMSRDKTQSLSNRDDFNNLEKFRNKSNLTINHNIMINIEGYFIYESNYLVYSPRW